MIDVIKLLGIICLLFIVSYLYSRFNNYMNKKRINLIENEINSKETICNYRKINYIITSTIHDIEKFYKKNISLKIGDEKKISNNYKLLNELLIKAENHSMDKKDLTSLLEILNNQRIINNYF